MSVSEGSPGAGRAVASGVMAEAGAMVPTSDSDLTGWSKVSVLQLLRMSLHARLRTTTLLQHFQARRHDACLKRSIVAHPTGPRECNFHLAGSSPCHAEAGELQQNAKSSFQTFCPQLYRPTVRVSLLYAPTVYSTDFGLLGCAYVG